MTPVSPRCRNKFLCLVNNNIYFLWESTLFPMNMSISGYLHRRLYNCFFGRTTSTSREQDPDVVVSLDMVFPETNMDRLFLNAQQTFTPSLGALNGLFYSTRDAAAFAQLQKSSKSLFLDVRQLVNNCISSYSGVAMRPIANEVRIFTVDRWNQGYSAYPD